MYKATKSAFVRDLIKKKAKELKKQLSKYPNGNNAR